jgi:hypothetical protein
MSTTAGTVRLADQQGVACAGEAHLNLYTDDSTLVGYCSCVTGSDAETLAGFINGVVVDGVLTGTWAADNGIDAIDVGVTGTIDATALNADLAGTVDWVDFQGTVDGAPL